MDHLIEDEEEELEFKSSPSNGLILQTAPGAYVIFPAGIGPFAAKLNAVAVGIDPDGEIVILREGMGNKYKWVSVVEAAD